MGATDYEQRMGEWVTARLRKRKSDLSVEMPQEVKDWLDNGGNSPADKNTVPTVSVVGWLIKTTVDPDWPETR